MARFTCNFISYTLSRAVDITVVIPTVTIPETMAPDTPRHTKEQRFPVLYLLHGYGNNHATWSGYSNIEMYAEENNIAVVMFSAENKFYVNHQAGDAFYDFVEEELPDFITGMFPISSRKEDTYIAGLSMGGYGALIHGLGNPEKYASVGAFSSALDIKGSGVNLGLDLAFLEEINPHIIVEKAFAAGDELPPIYLACGKEDFLFEANKRFYNEVKSLGGRITWDELPDYGHEWRFWDIEVERFITWLPRTDAYARSSKRSV